MSNYSTLPQDGGVPNVGYAPGYPPQGQGQAPGYPPQGQAPGYPPQGQGQAPGYPPQGQAPGYPPQGQAPGYPPQAPGVPPAAGYNQAGAAPAGQAGANPTAPEFEAVPGYGSIGFDGAFLPPPSYEEVAREPPQREDIPSTAFLTAEDAKEALQNFVAEHCCYGKGPIDEIHINDLRSSSAFHYTLESFCEGRSTKWKDEPFHGQPVIVTGLPPGPWDIVAPPPEMFRNGELNMEVPNTACVKPCHHCHARGFKTCHFCHGRGRKDCGPCCGSGRSHGEQCNFCHGCGHEKCHHCHGDGRNRCHKCNGHANLRWFIQLKIVWKNHDDHHVVERTALPSELVKNVSGQQAFEETNQRVWPVNHFPEQEINNASNALVQVHSSKFPTERMLMQRHKVRIIPVTEVFYKFKETNNASFFVFGLERKVHFPDYPSQCCGCCSIL